jgi:hypothetical protein
VGSRRQAVADAPHRFDAGVPEPVGIGNQRVTNLIVRRPHRHGRRLAAARSPRRYPCKPCGCGQAIWIDWYKEALANASDPRKDGCAPGYQSWVFIRFPL